MTDKQQREHVAALRALVERMEAELGPDEASSPAAPVQPADAKVFSFGERSLHRMRGVHPDLRAVAHYALSISPIDFGIPETGGVRTAELQAKLLAKGKSKTQNSRHLTGHALDVYAVVGGAVSWRGEHILAIHDAFMLAGKQLGVPLRWGGDWDMDEVRERGEDDLVHHELPRGAYALDPASRSAAAAEYLRRTRTASSR